MVSEAAEKARAGGQSCQTPGLPVFNRSQLRSDPAKLQSSNDEALVTYP
jgi:hypothetical protein